MNTRDYKLFRTGHYYHIYNRGDNRERIFLDDQDFLNFLKRIKLALGINIDSKLRIHAVPPGSFDILSYCLMDNHFHFLIKQLTDLPVTTLINKISTSYAKYFNTKYDRIGNLFQDTFKAKIVNNDAYLTYLSAYIHTNPENPFNYQYSSLPEYIGTRNGNLCKPEFILNFFEGNKEKYREFVQSYSFKEHQTIKHLAFDED